MKINLKQGQHTIAPSKEALLEVIEKCYDRETWFNRQILEIAAAEDENLVLEHSRFGILLLSNTAICDNGSELVPWSDAITVPEPPSMNQIERHGKEARAAERSHHIERQARNITRLLQELTADCQDLNELANLLGDDRFHSRRFVPTSIRDAYNELEEVVRKERNDAQ